MGFSCRKIQKLKAYIYLIFCMISLMQFCVLCGAESQVTLENFVFPQYSESEHRLQMIIFGETALNKGRHIYLTGVILDPVAPHVSAMSQVQSVPGRSVKPYLLLSDDKIITQFWKDKTHSNAMIFTRAAVFDRNSKICSSDEKVSLRSRELDADGVGFDINLNKRKIHVRSQVKVVLRSGDGESIFKENVQSPGEQEFNIEQRKVMNQIFK